MQNSERLRELIAKWRLAVKGMTTAQTGWQKPYKPNDALAVEQCADELEALLGATPPPPIIRCHDCEATLLYEETAEGYEVIHSCKDGKQVREMFEALGATPTEPAVGAQWPKGPLGPDLEDL